MEKTNITFFAEACGGRLLGKRDNEISSMVIDSRSACEGSIFVCIVGEKNDGHNYWKKAYDLGCRAFLMSDPVAAEDAAKLASVVLADNTEKAFARMAGAYLDQFDVIKVGVTGSVGKTSTKMLTAAVLSEKYNTVCTQKNLNTQLGLCLTCFLADSKTQAVVFEMGMDRKGEIAEYCEWVRPDAALITMIGVSHLERLGTRSEICNAKLEITSFLAPGDPLFYNEDDEFLYEEEIRRRTNGNFDCCPVLGPNGAFVLKNARTLGTEGIEFELEAGDEKQEFYLPMLGLHNARNAALACALGQEFGVTLAEAAEGLKKVVPTDRRLKAVEIGGVYLIDDSYNAAPDSMISALDVLDSVGEGRKVAIISDMLELGSDEAPGHRRVGKRISELGIDAVLMTGQHINYYLEGINEIGFAGDYIGQFESVQELCNFIGTFVKPGDSVLVKGSNSTGISTAAQKIKEVFEK